jgi:hypothetical protein
MKHALLIGINYKNTQGELKGCINDILEVKDVLEQQFKYTNFTIMTDDTTIKPTKVNILNELNKLISNSQLYQEIWIHYSGHGTYIKDKNRDESDGLDEALVPLDYQKNGLIIDDELNNIISKSKCNTRIILDCCHSGSALDLCYNLKINNGQIVKYYENKNYVSKNNNNIFMISGCADNQTSADSSDPLKNISMGAMTSAFLRILKKNNYKITVSNLILQLNQLLTTEGYSQRPVFSSNKDIALNSLYIMPSNSSKNIEEPNIFEEEPKPEEPKPEEPKPEEPKPEEPKPEEPKPEEPKPEEPKPEYLNNNSALNKFWYFYKYLYEFIYNKFFA